MRPFSGNIRAFISARIINLAYDSFDKCFVALGKELFGQCSYLIKSGFNVNQPSAGKKCIGTTKPGNNSGESTVSGSFIAIGPKIVAKESMVNNKLKTISPFAFNALSSNQ